MKGGSSSGNRRGAVRRGAALALAMAIGFAPDALADQWMTAATGGTTNNGDSISLTFGNGVTATYRQAATTNAPVSCGPVYAAGATALAGTNAATFLEPDPPLTSSAVNQCLIGSSGGVVSSVTHAFGFNKPVLAPVLHLLNLDSTRYRVDGRTTSNGTVALQTLVKNAEMEVAETTLPATFNATPQPAINIGCEANDNVTNPNGACGSFRLGGGPIQNWTGTNETLGTLTSGQNDGWGWSVSFQLARLTKAFGAASILSGTTTTLTFTIDNTNATNGTNAATATALGPLDFTDTFPAGLTIANATTSGTCAGAVFQDAGGGGLGAGDTGVRVTGFTVPVDASCTLTVNVTATAGGTYTNTASNASSTIGNLVLAPNASLTVIAQPNFGTCDSRLWLEQSPGPPTPTTLYQIGTNANPLTFNAVGTATSIYNAVGYNPTDNYQYGLIANPAGNTLVRIGADGSAQSAGAVTGLPSAVYNSGAFGTAGNILYVKDNNAAGTTLYAINVTTLSATPITLSAAINIADWAWVGGLLYGVTNGGQLVSVNPSTGAVTNIGVPNGLPAGFFGAMYGAPNGLYGSGNNPPSGFYKFDLTTGAATLISGAPGSSSNDGSNCPTANITFGADLQITKTNTPASGPSDQANDSYTPGTARTYTVVVTNAGPFGAANAVFTDPSIPNFTVSSVTCGSPTGGGVCPSVANTTVALMQGGGIVIPSLPYSSNTASSVTFTVTGTVAAGATGALANVANVAAGAGTSDATPANNSATDTDTPTGTIVIVKDAVPNSAQDFAFTATGTGLSAFSLDDDADATLSNTRTFTGLEPGSYTVTETAQSGWNLTGLSCSDPTGNSTGNTGTGVASIALASGETVTCTYVNTQQATLTVTKTAIGGGAAFPFVLSGAISDTTFQPNPNPPSTPSVSKTYANVAVGSDILITENAPASAGYTLTSISCTDSGAPGSTVGAPNYTNNATTLGNITVNLVPGANLICTFTNVKNADLTIVKNAIGGNTTVSYTVSDSPAGTIIATPSLTTSGGTGSADADFSIPNNVSRTVNITETVPAGYQLTSISCSATTGTLITNSTNLATATVNITAVPGTVGNCVFVNLRKPTITVAKLSVGGTANFAFSGGSNGLPASLNLDTAVSNPRSSTAFAVADATQPASLSETVPSGWLLTGWSCVTGGGTEVAAGTTATMTVPASAIDDGNDLTCTFSNSKQPQLRLRKALPLGRFVDGDQFALSIAGPGGPAGATTTGSGTVANEEAQLNPATVGAAYTLTETGSSGANLASYVTTYACTNAQAGGQAPSGSGTTFNLTAAAGDDLICTFTNTRNPLADLVITKTNTPGSGASDQPADTLARGATTAYTIVVTNNGPDAVTGAVLTDPPGSRQGLTCTSPPSCTGTACPAGLTLAQLESGVALGTLANGASVTVALTCTVD